MVRLSELVNQVRRRMSEGKNFAQNPLQMVKQSIYKYGILLYGKLSLPTDKDKKISNPNTLSELEPEHIIDTVVGESPQPSQNNIPLATVSSVGKKHAVGHSQNLNQDMPLWQPILQPGERLQGGWWGVYTIKSCMFNQGWIRCYNGLQDNGNEPVWIYEYCFDEDIWSDDEIDERKRRFKHLIDLNLRLGEGSDFRIIRLKDVIKPAGNCVYLITRPIPKSLTLDELLEQQPIPWTRLQIERFLTQVLQSLQYLQTYLVNWPGDRWEQKLSHGSLSGECLWIRLPEDHAELSQSPFFVYLGRFPLWEHMFWPQQTPIAQHNREIGSIDDDLKALAYLTFALIRGYHNEDDPTDLNLWPDDSSIRALYPYVLQLLGHGENTRFKSIDSAISVLQALPESYYSSSEELEELPTAIEESSEKSSVLLPLPLLFLGGGILIGLIAWLAGSVQSERSSLACTYPCRLEDVDSDGLSQPLRYGIEDGSSWSKAFFSTLTSPLKESRLNSRFGITELQRTLYERDPAFPLEKARDVLIPKNLLLEYLRTDSLDVALIQNSPNLPSDLEKRVVGYDGIAIFVTHSNAQRKDNIPKRLRGRISLQKLRQILLDPNASLDGARVQLYWPEDDVTVDLLQDSLFEHDADKVEFERRRYEETPFSRVAFSEESDQRDNNMYERMLSDFESNAQTGNEDIIGIGFNRISQVIGQCSVYPLALVEGGRDYHLFVNAEGNPIDQTTDLCGDKGTYWVNNRLFQAAGVRYPLTYEMAVVYHRFADIESCDRYKKGCGEGQLLADKLLTPEGQYLLSEAGLVPVLPIQDIRKMMWSPMARGGAQ